MASLSCLMFIARQVKRSVATLKLTYVEEAVKQTRWCSFPRLMIEFNAKR